MTFVPFNEADEIGDRFLALLGRHGICPPLGVAMEDELLSLTELIEVFKNPGVAVASGRVELLRSAAGLHDLAAKVLSVETIAEFETFIPHLRLIAKASSYPSSAVQNRSSDIRDDTSRKMAELYVACLAAHVGTQLELDSPTNARGDNPDVMLTLHRSSPEGRRAERWALAIKTISSRSGQTIFERIQEGAQQIDAPSCLADRGIVIINAKSALDHDRLWNTEFKNIDRAMSALGNQLAELIERASADRPRSEWDAIFSGKVARPILFLGQSLVCLPTIAGDRTPTVVKMFVEHGASGTLDPLGHQLADAMNHHMQTVLRGVPGIDGEKPG